MTKMNEDWKKKALGSEEIAALIPHGANVFVHGAAATPSPLLDAMCAREDLRGVTLYHLHTAGPCDFASEKHRDRFFSVSLFTGPALREPIAQGVADFIPVFLADIPGLFKNGDVKLDVALVQLSEPDAHGYCTLGTSVDTAMAAVESADIVIAEINAQVPRTHGRTFVHLSKVSAFMSTDRPLYVHDPAPQDAVISQIGERIAALVEDGSTLQMGIGAIPDAVLARLGDKVDLGIHTEMFSDGVIPLVEGGVINNRHKAVHPGRLVTSFVMGTRRLYDFVDDNPSVEFHPCDRTNDIDLIRRNPSVVAINSALEVDLSGQVCADSIGHRIYSGIGGQMDFIKGAAMSQGGKPVLALPSTAARGQVSRITTALKPGAGVVTTRGHVHWVVTEYGAVNLHGKTLRQRAELLISLAHPDFRPQLRKEINGLRHFHFA